MTIRGSALSLRGATTPEAPTPVPPPAPKEVARQRIDATAAHTQTFLAHQEAARHSQSLLRQDTAWLAPHVGFVQQLGQEPAGSHTRADRFLALLNLGSQAAGTSYEGGDPLVPVQGMANVLGIIGQGHGLFTRQAAAAHAYDELSGNISQQLTAEIALLKDFQFSRLPKPQYLDHLQRQITSLPNGASFIMPGGYQDHPEGHAMYYRFQKLPSGNFRVFIYNAQQTSSRLQGGEVVSDESGIHERCLPYEVIDEVTAAELFAPPPPNPFYPAKPSVIDQLVEMLIPVTSQQHHLATDIKKIFTQTHPGVAAKLLPSEVVRRQFTSKLISTQASGNCTQKSVHCVALDLVPNREDFKALTHDERFFSNVAYYLANKHRLAAPTSADQTMVAEFERSVRNFLTKLDHALTREAQDLLLRTHGSRTPPTDEEYEAAIAQVYGDDYATAYATMHEILEHIEQAKALGFPLTRGGPLPDERMALTATAHPLPLQPLLEPALTDIQQQSQAAAFVLPPYQFNPLLGQGCTWSQLPALLDRLDRTVQDMAYQDSEATSWQIESTLRNLSHLKLEFLRDPALAGLSPAEAQAALLKLENILDRYKFAVLGAGESLATNKRNTSNEFMAIAYCLACQADNATPKHALREFGISFSTGILWTEDPRVAEQQQSLIRFFSAINTDRDALLGETSNSDDTKLKENAYPEAALYSHYIDPSLLQSPLATRLPDTPPDYLPEDVVKYQLISSLRYQDVPPQLHHLTSLRRIILRSQEFQRPAYVLSVIPPLDQHTLVRQGPFIFELPTNNLPSYPEDISAPSYVPNAAEFLVYCSAASALQENEALTRQYSQLQATVSPKEENEALARGMGPLDVAASKRELNPITLLLTLRNHLDQISDPAWRQKFNALFFRTTTKGSDPNLHDFLATNPQFIAEIDELTREALLTFKTSQPPGQEKIDELLFVLGLRAKVCQSLATHGPLSQEAQALNQTCIQELDQLITSRAADPKTNIRELQLAKAGLLLATLPTPSANAPLPPLSPAAAQPLASLFCALSVARHSTVPVSDQPFLRNTTALIPTTILLWQSFISQPQARDDFANQVLQKYRPGTPNLAWQINPQGHLTAQAGDNVWTINLTRTEVTLSEHGGPPTSLREESRITNPPLDFQRLFGPPEYNCTKIGNALYFQHPKLGECCIVNNKLIQRKIAGQWYTYLGIKDKHLTTPCDNDDAAQALCEHLSLPLVSEHAHWLATTTPPTILVSDLASGEIQYHVDHSGIVHPAHHAQDEHIVVDETTTLLQPDPAALPLPLKRFLQAGPQSEEKGLWFSAWGTNGGTTPDLIELPTFAPAGAGQQEPLRFHRSPDGKWHYDADPRFVIDETYQPALAEHFGNYIPLVNAEGQHKVLIPRGDVRSEGFSHRCDITTDRELDKARLSNSFFEYDVEGANISSRNLAANLYLAQLYLAQHRYADALNIIQRISVSEPIPERDKKLITELGRQLVLAGRNIHDNSPTNLAIRLHAYLKMKAILPLFSTSDASSNDRPTLVFPYRDYLARLSSIPPQLALPLDEERKIVSLFRAKDFPERRAFLLETTRPRIRTTVDSAPPGVQEPRPIKTLIGATTIDRNRLEAIPTGTPTPRPGDLSYLNENDLFYRDWQTRLLIPPPASERPPSPLQASSFATSITHAAETDPIYADAIREHGDFYLRDSQTAARKLRDQAKLTPDRASLEAAQKAMTDEKARAEARASVLEGQIMAIGRSQGSQIGGPAIQSRQLLSLIRSEATERKPLELRQLLWAATSGPTALQQINPFLSAEDAVTLQQACLEYMVETTHVEHLSRILKPMGDYLAIPAGPANEDQRRITQKALEDQLRERRTYTPSDQLRPLFFEWISHMRLRERQASIVTGILTPPGEPGSKRDEVFGVIMGGGKSSVIFPYSVSAIADTGVPTFIVSVPAQAASAQGNMSTFFREEFGKELYEIKFTPDDLNNPAALRRIIDRMREAQAKKCPIHVTTTFPRTIQIKLDIERQRIENTVGEDAEKRQMELIGLLSQIDSFFKDGVGFFDECDSAFSVLSAVNIPSGAAQHVSDTRITTVKEFYRHLIGQPNLLERTGLLQNEQRNLPEPTYRQQILPAMAEHFVGYPPLGLAGRPDMHAALLRFLQTPFKRDPTVPTPPGGISVADEELAASSVDIATLSGAQRENVAFLRLLDSWHASENPKEREQAQQITLLRGFLNELAPFTFQQGCNDGYGRNVEADNGAVVPWRDGRAEPTTQFGYHYTALAYHFQTALNTPISSGEISFLAQQLVSQATTTLQTRLGRFEDTEAAQLFAHLTGGQSLTPFTKPDSPAAREAMARVLAFINDPAHPERRLDLEEQVARQHVTYYPSRISSSSVDLPAQFGRCIACSGTLWNTPTFNSRLGEPDREEGTEGSIFNLLLQRADMAETLREIPAGDLGHLLNLMRDYLTHPHEKPLRGIIDAGNFLWKQDMEVAARQVLDLFDQLKPPGGAPEMEAVIYFRAGSFYLLRRGGEPKELHDTTPEEIRRVARDLPMSKIFTIYDKARATGTDIRQSPDSLNLLTIDPEMNARTDLQSDMRLRGLADRQDLISVVTTGGRAKMLGGGKTLADVFATQVRTEAIALSDQTYRSYLLEMQHIVKEAAQKKLAVAEREGAAALRVAIGRYKHLLFESQEDDPFLQYRSIGQLADPVAQLTTRRDQMLQQLPPELREEVEPGLGALIERARGDRHLPRAVPASGAGTNMQAQVEVQQQTQVAQQQNVQQELQQEEELYNYKAEGMPFKEVPWEIELRGGAAIEDTVPGITAGRLMNATSLATRLVSAADVCRDTYQTPTGPIQTGQYAELFPPDFLMTQNFRQTMNSQLPIFHRLNKEAKFVLFVRSGVGFQKVLLSQHDATYFRKALKERSIDNAWLFSVDGLPVDTKPMPSDPDFRRNVEEGLWYANAYNGHTTYLERHRDVSERIIGTDPDRRKLFGKFVALRAGTRTPQGVMAMHSDLFQPLSLERRREIEAEASRRPIQIT